MLALALTPAGACSSKYGRWYMVHDDGDEEDLDAIEVGFAVANYAEGRSSHCEAEAAYVAKVPNACTTPRMLNRTLHPPHSRSTRWHSQRWRRKHHGARASFVISRGAMTTTTKARATRRALRQPWCPVSTLGFHPPPPPPLDSPSPMPSTEACRGALRGCALNALIWQAARGSG